MHYLFWDSDDAKIEFHYPYYACNVNKNQKQKQTKTCGQIIAIEVSCGSIISKNVLNYHKRKKLLQQHT